MFGQWRHDLVFTTRGSFSVQEALTGEQALIRFLDLKGLLVLWLAL